MRTRARALCLSAACWACYWHADSLSSACAWAGPQARGRRIEELHPAAVGVPLRAALGAGSTHLAGLPASSEPRRGAPEPPRSRMRRHFASLNLVKEGRRFIKRLQGSDIFNRFGTGSTAGPLEVGMLEETDVAEVSVLLQQAFERDFAGARAEQLGLFAGIAGPWLAWKSGKDPDEIATNLRLRAQAGMQFPSLVRPVQENQASVFLARQRTRRGPGELVGCFELSLVTPDGRKPDDKIECGREDPEMMPYLSNLAVKSDYRGGGLGASLVTLAETIVTRAWADDVMYLHHDTYEPSRKLYAKTNFERAAPVTDEGISWMMKKLELPDFGVEEEEEIFVDDIEQEDSDDEDDELLLPEARTMKKEFNIKMITDTIDKEATEMEEAALPRPETDIPLESGYEEVPDDEDEEIAVTGGYTK
mmetsp:Transcript_72499/g.208039  ORF Transcript_72499/g.208039 Transcript_72499/m.208039 type:complete len:420 (-) Transcript_72499:198-1457(-)